LGNFFQPVGRLVEGLFGHAEGVHRRRHTAVKDHLADDLRDLFPGDADMQRPRDVPLDHLGAVAQDHQGGDGAEAAGLQINGRPVVYLAVDDGINQLHDLRRQLGHGRWRIGVIVGTVVGLPEVDGSLVQVFGGFVGAQVVSKQC
tara:strand:- start:1551 stop:1985 length:435 start_codon:yes stop_codon:yes gene_type:complete